MVNYNSAKTTEKREGMKVFANMAESSKLRTFINAFTISGLSVLARLLGFISQIILARTFGTSMEMDAYFAVLSIPTILSGIAPVIFSAVLMPSLMSLKSNDFERQRLARMLLGQAAVLSIFVAGLGWLISPLVVQMFFPQLPTDLNIVTVQASRWVWAASGVSMLVSYMSAIRNADRRFGRVAFIVLLPAATIIACVLTLSSHLGIRSIALGLFISSLLQAGILFPCTFPALSLRAIAPTYHPDLRLILERIVPVILSLLPFTILGFITVYWAVGLPTGCVSYLGYSQGFAGFLSVAVGYGISVVSFPDMAEKFATGCGDSVFSVFEHRLHYVFLLAALGAVFIFVLRMPILGIAYQHGNFSSASLQGVASVLPWYLIGAVGIACLNLLRTFYYSMGNVIPLAGLGVAVPIAYFALAGWLSRWLSYEGIGMAYAGVSILWLLGALTLLPIGRYGLWSRDLFCFIVKVTIASLTSLLLTVWIQSILSSIVQEWLIIIMGIGIVVTVFTGVACFVLRIDEVRRIVAWTFNIQMLGNKLR